MSKNPRTTRSLPQLPVEFEVPAPRGRGRPRVAVDNNDVTQGQGANPAGAAGNDAAILPLAAPLAAPPAAPPAEPPAAHQQPLVPRVPLRAQQADVPPVAPSAAFSFGDFHQWAYPPGYMYPTYYHGSYVPPNLHVPPAQQCAGMQVPAVEAQVAGRPPALAAPTGLQAADAIGNPAALWPAGPLPPAAPPGPAIPAAPAVPHQAATIGPAVAPPPVAAPGSAVAPPPVAAPGPAVPPAAPQASDNVPSEKAEQTIARLRKLLTESQRSNAELSKYVNNLEKQIEYLQDRNKRNNYNNNKFDEKKFYSRRFKGF